MRLYNLGERESRSFENLWRQDTCTSQSTSLFPLDYFIDFSLSSSFSFYYSHSYRPKYDRYTDHVDVDLHGETIPRGKYQKYYSYIYAMFIMYSYHLNYSLCTHPYVHTYIIYRGVSLQSSRNGVCVCVRDKYRER